MAERSNAAVLKTAEVARLPWVRIPPPPRRLANRGVLVIALWMDALECATQDQISVEPIVGVVETEPRLDVVAEAPSWLGATTSCVVVAYAICDSQPPSLHAASGDRTLQVVLSSRRWRG